jgi:hypothetical protein
VNSTCVSLHQICHQTTSYAMLMLFIFPQQIPRPKQHSTNASYPPPIYDTDAYIYKLATAVISLRIISCAAAIF